VAFGVALGVLAPASAPAQDGTDGVPGGRVLVINVSGLIDPVVANFIEESVVEAEAIDATALILQINSEGSVLTDEAFVDLARTLRSSTVPIAAWIGPSGSKAQGGAAELFGLAETTGMAPGTHLGPVGTPRLTDEEFGGLLLFGVEGPRLEEDRITAEEANDLGFVTPFPPVEITSEDGRTVEVIGAPTVGDFIVNLPGVETREVTVDGQVRREPVTVVVFSRLSLLDQLAHTVASPAVAYLLLAVGIGLLVFEFYTAGIGIAGLIGAGCFAAACYGLWVLPTNGWAFALMLVAFFAFAIDVQTGVPRLWTVIGLVLLIVASFGLYDGLTVPWITLLVGVVGVVLTYYAGMPSMVRTRFSTPTIGRDWMIGELGTAVVEVAPTGVVKVRDALWRAETNRATPIAADGRIRVIGIDGLLLEVEPEEGGARDYRDRSRSTTGDSSDTDPKK
jgi:membrane-bound serine protease (ClpP class)